MKRNKQQVYEHVRAYFMENPYGFRDDIDACVYIGHDEHQMVHCAIGCQLELEDDEWNKLATDNGGLRDLEVDTLEIIREYIGVPWEGDEEFPVEAGERDMFNFQADIQGMHDSCAAAKQHKEYFIASLDDYAKRNGLKVVHGTT